MHHRKSVELHSSVYWQERQRDARLPILWEQKYEWKRWNVTATMNQRQNWEKNGKHFSQASWPANWVNRPEL